MIFLHRVRYKTANRTALLNHARAKANFGLIKFPISY